MLMIALLGASGYIGSRFRDHMNHSGIDYITISRSEVDILDSAALAHAIQDGGASFLINSAGYTGKPNVDACEDHKTECLLANSVLPGVVADACRKAGIAFGHVSSGCIFTGRRRDHRGFTELDEPNFSFQQNNCSFYSGTKALAEEVLADEDECYVWRLRIPFDGTKHPRNYLYKLLSYDTLLETENSLSYLDEFVQACFDCWRRKLPFGVYNLTNPGSVWTSDVTKLIDNYGLCSRQFKFFQDEAEFMRIAARTPRSSCVLDSSKAINAGLKLSPVKDAIRNCLLMWARTSHDAPVSSLSAKTRCTE